MSLVCSEAVTWGTPFLLGLNAGASWRGAGEAGVVVAVRARSPAAGAVARAAGPDHPRMGVGRRHGAGDGLSPKRRVAGCLLDLADVALDLIGFRVELDLADVALDLIGIRVEL